MKKLSKAITGKWFLEPTSFNDLRASWAALMKQRKDLPCAYHLAYKMLLGRDYASGITPGSETSARAIKQIRGKYSGAPVFEFFKNYVNPETAHKCIMARLAGNDNEYLEIDECLTST